MRYNLVNSEPYLGLLSTLNYHLTRFEPFGILLACIFKNSKDCSIKCVVNLEISGFVDFTDRNAPELKMKKITNRFHLKKIWSICCLID